MSKKISLTEALENVTKRKQHLFDTLDNISSITEPFDELNSALVFPDYQELTITKQINEYQNFINKINEPFMFIQTQKNYFNSFTDILESANAAKNTVGLTSSIFHEYISATQAFVTSINELLNVTDTNSVDEYINSDEVDNISTEFLDKTKKLVNCESDTTALSKKDKYDIAFKIATVLISLIPLIYQFNPNKSKDSTETTNNDSRVYNFNYQDNSTTNNYYFSKEEKEELDEYIAEKVKEILEEQTSK